MSDRLLGPLLDGAAASFLGLLAGLVVRSRASWIWDRVVKAVRAHLLAILGLALYGALLLGAEALIGGRGILHATIDGLVLLLVLVAVIFSGRYLRLRTLRAILVAVYTVLVGGVALYALRHSIQQGSLGAAA